MSVEAASSPSVCLIAAPLMARSGVYRSTIDLVREARSRGLDWTAEIGLRASALTQASTPIGGVHEFEVRAHGRSVIGELERSLMASASIRQADFVITLITQSDVAMSHLRSRLRATWVAWVRGLPWPDRGEQSHLRTIYLRALERRALRSADDVWATTPILASQISSAVQPRLVVAGIPPAPRRSWGEDGESPLVWAGRIDQDKQPELFVDIVRLLGTRGHIIGAGPQEQALRSRATKGIEWRGWLPAERMWDNVSIFLGTAWREAFGRSAAEAALAGLPIVISDQYGVAPLLYTDPDYRQRFVLPVDQIDAWLDAVTTLRSDGELRRQVSDHVHQNAARLTIAASLDAALEQLRR